MIELFYKIRIRKW